MLMFYSFFIFLSFATSIGFPMICTVACQLIVGLGPHAMIYEKGLTFIMVVSNLLNATWCFVLMVTAAMLFTYIVQIKAELVEIMNENV